MSTEETWRGGAAERPWGAGAPSLDLPLSGVPAALEARFGPLGQGSRPATGKHASVALVLRPPSVHNEPALASAAELLVIRRAVHERDPWSGHMALPGGRMQHEDEDLLATAVRETMEETAVDLDAGGRPLGRVDVMRPAGRGLPAITIWPFVFQVEPATTAAVNAPHEVERVYWLPLTELVAESNQSVYSVTRQGVTLRFPCIRVEGEVIWGITYRIVQDLIRAF
ncbi:MAG: CoA pyrophosphatase [Gemmatimonadetes bacterium]|nr:CoA pyrophosphatase [Gemmatimonadota bacterium]